MISLDTHCWYWLAVDSPRLPRRLKSRLATEALTISSTSVWELAFLVESGRLRVDRDLQQFIDAALALEGLEVAPITSRIAVRAAKLGPLFPRDPADRLITATAMEFGVPLATSDEAITRSGVVPILWD